MLILCSARCPLNLRNQIVLKKRGKDGNILLTDDFDVVGAALDEVYVVAEVIKEHRTAGFCQGVIFLLCLLENFGQNTDFKCLRRLNFHGLVAVYYRFLKLGYGELKMIFHGLADVRASFIVTFPEKL